MFTPSVKALQTQYESREAYAHATARNDDPAGLGSEETAFLQAADHFFLSSVGESGWPYVQHRGGPRGFLHVLGPKQIGFADFRGNQQFISAGNVAANPRAALLVMDYAHQARLKLIGCLRLMPIQEVDPALQTRLVHADYPGRADRIALLDVEAFDWNCSQHIVPRFTSEEIAAVTAPLRLQIAELQDRLRAVNIGTGQSAQPAPG